MATIREIVERAEEMMTPPRSGDSYLEADKLVRLREKRPDNVTWQQYEYWPSVLFMKRGEKIYYCYKGWGGKALPHVHDFFGEITPEMIEKDDVGRKLPRIKDDWVLAALGLLKEEEEGCETITA